MSLRKTKFLSETCHIFVVACSAAEWWWDTWNDLAYRDADFRILIWNQIFFLIPRLSTLIAYQPILDHFAQFCAFFQIFFFFFCRTKWHLCQVCNHSLKAPHPKLRWYYTHNQKLACFVLYLKIINTFLTINVHILK